ncbi:hypothetical protein AK88_02017 [Plasmodium fragile]|uniref:Schizont-infected cell agglutination extracellular alpha domain-containing protein n=1 Tax=Plasmodium fragile TaxID=5857 RepID=A0A0D9QMT0_PLAFR|nr:uncharacterized protein AK88_02017 [Plasmodium fragile]KJP88400.1 hypothetical protein AK88_02017 [Plasmodium fragile]
MMRSISFFHFPSQAHNVLLEGAIETISECKNEYEQRESCYKVAKCYPSNGKDVMQQWLEAINERRTEHNLQYRYDIAEFKIKYTQMNEKRTSRMLNESIYEEQNTVDNEYMVDLYNKDNDFIVKYFTNSMVKWIQGEKISGRSKYSERIWDDMREVFREFSEYIGNDENEFRVLCDDEVEGEEKIKEEDKPVCEIAAKILSYMDGVHSKEGMKTSGDGERGEIRSTIRCIMGNAYIWELLRRTCGRKDGIEYAMRAIRQLKNDMKNEHNDGGCVDLHWEGLNMTDKNIEETGAGRIRDNKGIMGIMEQININDECTGLNKNGARVNSMDDVNGLRKEIMEQIKRLQGAVGEIRKIVTGEHMGIEHTGNLPVNTGGHMPPSNATSPNKGSTEGNTIARTGETDDANPIMKTTRPTSVKLEASKGNKGASANDNNKQEQSSRPHDNVTNPFGGTGNIQISTGTISPSSSPSSGSPTPVLTGTAENAQLAATESVAQKEAPKTQERENVASDKSDETAEHSKEDLVVSTDVSPGDQGRLGEEGNSGHQHDKASASNQAHSEGDPSNRDGVQAAKEQKSKDDHSAPTTTTGDASHVKATAAASSEIASTHTVPTGAPALSPPGDETIQTAKDTGQTTPGTGENQPSGLSAVGGGSTEPAKNTDPTGQNITLDSTKAPEVAANPVSTKDVAVPDGGKDDSPPRDPSGNVGSDVNAEQSNPKKDYTKDPWDFTDIPGFHDFSVVDGKRSGTAIHGGSSSSSASGITVKPDIRAPLATDSVPTPGSEPNTNITVPNENGHLGSNVSVHGTANDTVHTLKNKNDTSEKDLQKHNFRNNDMRHGEPKLEQTRGAKGYHKDSIMNDEAQGREHVNEDIFMTSRGSNHLNSLNNLSNRKLNIDQYKSRDVNATRKNIIYLSEVRKCNNIISLVYCKSTEDRTSSGTCSRERSKNLCCSISDFCLNYFVAGSDEYFNCMKKEFQDPLYMCFTTGSFRGM